METSRPRVINFVCVRTELNITSNLKLSQFLLIIDLKNTKILLMLYSGVTGISYLRSFFIQFRKILWFHSCLKLQLLPKVKDALAAGLQKCIQRLTVSSVYTLQCFYTYEEQNLFKPNFFRLERTRNNLVTTLKFYIFLFTEMKTFKNRVMNLLITNASTQLMSLLIL